jgi:primosomal replication protein N
MVMDKYEKPRRRSGLNNVNLSGCVFSRPRLRNVGEKKECRFWVGDGPKPRQAKLELEAVAHGQRGVELAERLDCGDRVALTGMFRSSTVRVAGGEVLDYELLVSHADAGEMLEGQCVEQGGLNLLALSGVVTQAPEIVGLPGRDECVFWMCDGDSEEESSVRVPVFVAPGKVAAFADHVEVGDRLAIGGFLRSRKLFVAGSHMYEYEVVATYVDGGFLSSGERGPAV